MHADTLDCYAICHPGLESVTAGEMRELGLDAGEPQVGGVPFRGDAGALMRANLHLRTAGRVLVRLGRFRATAFWELEKRARALPWAGYLERSTPVRLRVTCKKSKLYHSDAVAERVAEAARAAAGAALASGAAPSDDEDVEEDGAQLVVVRLHHDACTVSVDASGALLHRRGWRRAVAKAPLRETMAAAMLRLAGWDARAPLLDPMCGAGTIPIEAALVARGIAPGLGREFAFMRWPGFDRSAWEALVARAREAERPAAPGPIVGSDRDEGAVESARANAERAGVAGDVSFERRTVSDLAPAGDAPGALVTNPPYGKRVGDADVRDLWARLGQVARERLAGWSVTLLSPDPALERQLRLPLEERARTSNGGIPVRVVAGPVP